MACLSPYVCGSRIKCRQALGGRDYLLILCEGAVGGGRYRDRNSRYQRFRLCGVVGTTVEKIETGAVRQTRGREVIYLGPGGLGEL